MQFILFSSPTNFDGEIDLVNYFLLDKELVFHIRKPHFSLKELKSYIQLIPTQYHNQLVIHSHINLLNEFKLKGYHCTRFFLENSKHSLKEIKELYTNFTFSKSCHSLLDLEDTIAYNYVFLSPIFNSISKENYKPNFSFNEANTYIKQISIPVYALGGVSQEVVDQLINSNFKGLAVLGYVWNTLTPKKNYNKLRKALFLN